MKETIEQLRTERDRLTSEIESLRGLAGQADLKDQATTPPPPDSAESAGQADLADLWQQLRDDPRLTELVPAMEDPSVQFSQLVEIFAELIWWMHLIDRQIRESFGILGQKNDGIRQLVHTLDQQRIDLKSVLSQTFRLKRQQKRITRLRQYCFQFLYKPIVAIPHGYRAGLIGAERELQEELNPTTWSYSKDRLEAEDSAIGRHLREQIRRNLPINFAAFLQKLVAEKTYEGYNTIKMPSLTNRETRGT